MLKIIVDEVIKQLLACLKDNPSYNQFAYRINVNFEKSFTQIISAQLRVHLADENFFKQFDVYLKEDLELQKVILDENKAWTNKPNEYALQIPFYFGSPEYFMGLDVEKIPYADRVHNALVAYLKLLLIKEIIIFKNDLLTQDEQVFYRISILDIQKDIKEGKFKFPLNQLAIIENQQIHEPLLEKLQDGFETKYDSFYQNFNLKADGKFNIFHEMRSLRFNISVFIKHWFLNPTVIKAFLLFNKYKKEFYKDAWTMYQMFIGSKIKFLNKNQSIFTPPFQRNLYKLLRVSYITNIVYVLSNILINIFRMMSLTLYVVSITAYQFVSIIPNFIIITLHDRLRDLKESGIKDHLLAFIANFNVAFLSNMLGIIGGASINRLILASFIQLHILDFIFENAALILDKYFPDSAKVILVYYNKLMAIVAPLALFIPITLLFLNNLYLLVSATISASLVTAAIIVIPPLIINLIRNTVEILIEGMYTFLLHYNIVKPLVVGILEEPLENKVFPKEINMLIFEHKLNDFNFLFNKLGCGKSYVIFDKITDVGIDDPLWSGQYKVKQVRVRADDPDELENFRNTYKHEILQLNARLIRKA